MTKLLGTTIADIIEFMRSSSVTLKINFYYTVRMTTRPIDIINKTMTYNSNPTADLVRPLFIVTPYARYVQFSSRVRWLNSDDELGMNSEAYEMYVLSKRIRHKYQVKYVSQAPLTRLFFHFNRHHLEQIMDKEQIFKYVDDDYDPHADVEILAVYEN